jgi:bifunctional non-homologous end joining protein LigD
MPVKSTSLYFTEGGSDKVYNAQIEQDGDGYRVFFQYGRRGGALKDGEKTSGPVPLDKAEKVYDALVKSKTKKGYTEQESGAVFTSAEHAGQVTGFRPQLLNAITLEHLEGMGPGWFVQEKQDGERRGIIAKDGELRFANRSGLEVGVDKRIADAVQHLASLLPEGFVFDAEDMGDHVVVFDVVEHPALREKATFEERAGLLAALDEVMQSAPAAHAEALRFDVPVELDAFLRSGGVVRLRHENAEGAVFRRAESLYEPGRPNSGGDALKLKFVESCTVRVAARNEGKRSVSMELLDESGAWTTVGNVTIPEGSQLAKGDLVEVEYLYAYEGGSLFQPVFKGQRTDLEEDACSMSQLKFKRTAPGAEPVAVEDGMSL